MSIRRSELPPTGIASIGIQLPPLAMEVAELADLRGVDPGKYTIGLGCGEMALCPADHGAVDLAVGAAERALARWGGRIEDIGLLALGTESALDMSRPLSAFVADRLGLAGAVRSYEVKHACYGGTLALKQAVEWRLSGAAAGKAALVVASDVALYAPEDPGEPTQGAGAVAMVIDQPLVALIEPRSYAWSEPQFDFWRPVGEEFPRVDGPLSLDCYCRAAEKCFGAWVEEAGMAAVDQARGVCFHVPFPKMVQKAVRRLGASFGWDEQRTAEFFDQRVNPTMEWNRRCGNAYTASLWIAVANALVGAQPGERVLAFSYGSGFGSELVLLSAGPEAARAPWAVDVAADLESRTLIDAQRYCQLRATELVAPVTV